MTPTYCYLHLRGSGRDSSRLRQALADGVVGSWRRGGIAVWGIWEGMFGVGSNELIVMAASAADVPATAFTGVLPGEVTTLDALALRPTVRPDSTAPCDRPGFYVFRFFRVMDRDVDEVAALSKEAWETFENTDAYRSQPQGLFRQAEPADAWGRMLLVTWYDGLDSWQTSRRPAPAATANFRRRRDLTDGTLALATRLVTEFP